MSPSRKRKERSPEGFARSKRLSKLPQHQTLLGRHSPDQAALEAELVDLIDVEDGDHLEEVMAKQRELKRKEQRQLEASQAIALSKSECVICMDKPTNLTVTHCGHLFCGECLHHAIHTGGGKKQCPVCRTAISTTLTGKDKQKQPRNGVFLMQVRIKSRPPKGKESVRK